MFGVVFDELCDGVAVGDGPGDLLGVCVLVSASDCSLGVV